MKILYCASEATPLMKTGGLADVAGSLPDALRAMGCDCRLVLPAYPDAIARAGKLESAAIIHLPGSKQVIRLFTCIIGHHQVPTYLVDVPQFFNRTGNPYVSPEGSNWPDNADRFGLFCRIVEMIAMDQCGLNWKPDLVHSNDWQTGLVSPLLMPHADRPATVFTIHNLAYQGLFDAQTFARLQLPEALWSLHGLEFYGQFSFIKGGIVYSDYVTTVSPTYADEIRTPTYGYGLEGLLRQRGEHFCGILNGINYHVWNPETDPRLVNNFNADNFALKLENKLALQAYFGLPQNKDVQLFGYIGRLVDQKGVDLILQVLPGILDHGAQVVFLGSGNKELENALLELSNKHPQVVGVTIGYNEQLSHRIEAGCDAFLMPSRFEPCGLNQMYSLRYGTVPIVRDTGGLADTVVDASPENIQNKTATGFVFHTPDAENLWRAVERALNYYKLPGNAWRDLAMRGMQQDFSWEASAASYTQIYKAAIDYSSREI